MRTFKSITFITLFLALGCGGGQRAANDTALGDDGGGETGAETPDPIKDHGVADFCLDRVTAYAEANPQAGTAFDEYHEHEFWYSPDGRAYTHHLDLEDKPSPLYVPNMCPVDWPLRAEYDGHTHGGSASCLNSGYHFQLPFVGFSDQAGPGDLEFPYSVDIVTNTIGNPPQAGRHTWMAPGCCQMPPTEEELASDQWAAVIQATGLTDTYRSHHADCRAYVRSIGVHVDAEGYPANYGPTQMLAREISNSRCISWGDYEPSTGIELASFTIGQPVVYHPTVYTDQYPANINYDWAASLGLIQWKDFEAFGATVDAILKAFLAYLYLPPDDFIHARYGAGGGCHFPVAIRWSDSAGGIVARLTCPHGYYAEFPNFYSDDASFRANGVVGTCTLDAGLDGIGYVNDGGILSPTTGSDGRHFAVHDIDGFGKVLAVAVEGGVVTAELAELMRDDSGAQMLVDGDDIAWWSSPWTEDPQVIEDALRLTLDHDVEDLVAATGWSAEDAEHWVDQQGLATLGELDVPGLPLEMMERPVSSLRAGSTWRMRVERGDEVMFFFFVQPGPAPPPD